MLVLAPLGACIQYIEEPLGAPWSFTVATVVDAVLLLTTTGIGRAFALKRMMPQHRQWIARSYAVALTFLESRFILGVTGLDQPLNLAAAETSVCASLALSFLVGYLRTSGTRDSSASAACITWVVKRAG